MKKPIYTEGIIFDLDGTLIDSTFQHFQAAMAVVEQLGGTPCNFSRYRNLLEHRTHCTLYQELGVRADEAAIVKSFISIWPDFSTTITPMPGVYEALQSLWGEGIVLGLVSGSQKDAVHAALHNFGLANFFNAAYVYGSSKRALVRKDDAFAELMYAWRIHQPERITVVGDMVTEMHAAKKHGMHAIGFLGGLGTRAMLQNAGAECCIRKLLTLAKIIS